MNVAYFGPEASNTHAAALAALPGRESYSPELTISQVFDRVASGDADCGVVPIENAIEGVVRETIDCLLSGPLLIFKEVELDIVHSLLAPPGLSPDQATRVESHPQALAQCRMYLDTHYPSLERVSAGSTSGSARDAAKRTDTLAIAPPLAAQTYGLAVVEPQISDRSHNVTRFACIAREDAEPTGRDRTTLVFSTPHQRGALLHALRTLDEAGVNLTRIESRPLVDRRWEYAFVVDVEGHRLDPDVAGALRGLEESRHLLKVLGSYPRAT
jgi:chorismate mutase/prephenate dehydratase